MYIFQSSDEDNTYSITEVEDFEDITTLDCENLRCAVFSATEAERGRPPMVCDKLHAPPDPSSIVDKVSTVLGDGFKHETKKGYKNALKKMKLT